MVVPIHHPYIFMGIFHDNPPARLGYPHDPNLLHQGVATLQGVGLRGRERLKTKWSAQRAIVGSTGNGRGFSCSRTGLFLERFANAFGVLMRGLNWESRSDPMVSDAEFIELNAVSVGFHCS